MIADKETYNHDRKIQQYRLLRRFRMVLITWVGFVVICCLLLTQSNGDKWWERYFSVKSPSPPVKRIFQVTEPTAGYGPPIATSTLVEHVFGNSWNKPFQHEYIPPIEDDFTNVKLQIKGNTYGVQFDRLGHLFIGDCEIWRTSTPEPGRNNITWDFVKDVSDYVTIFKQPQNITMYLNNIIDGRYTGPLDVTITAYFYKDPYLNTSPYSNSLEDWYGASGIPATTISPLVPDSNKVISLPNEDIKVELDTFPLNTTKVVLDVFASGNADEEFWYSHLLDEYAEYFSSDVNDFGKHGPSRFLEVYLDNYLVGFINPFSVIYTGGMSPALWNPIVGIKAYDVPSYHIDLTPFLPYLWTRKSVLTIRVINGLNNSLDAKMSDNDWLVSANILSWQVDGLQANTETSKAVSYKPMEQHVTTGYLSPEETDLVQVVSIQKQLQNTGHLEFAGHPPFEYTITQKSGMSNIQTVQESGSDQNVALAAFGYNKAEYVSADRATEIYHFEYSYPLIMSTEFLPESDNYQISLSRQFQQFWPIENRFIDTSLNGSSVSYIRGNKFLGGTSFTEQRYESNGFYQHIKARNGSVIWNRYNKKKVMKTDALTMSIETLTRKLLPNKKLSTQNAFSKANQFFKQRYITPILVNHNTTMPPISASSFLGRLPNTH